VSLARPGLRLVHSRVKLALPSEGAVCAPAGSGGTGFLPDETLPGLNKSHSPGAAGRIDTIEPRHSALKPRQSDGSHISDTLQVSISTSGLDPGIRSSLYQAHRGAQEKARLGRIPNLFRSYTEHRT
jgi:hypothetical protein